jgi:tRNA threonylcarbamoyl adenosine modification protein YeaZ
MMAMREWHGVSIVLDGAAGPISCALVVDGVVVGHAVADRASAPAAGPAEAIGGVLRGLLHRARLGSSIDRVIVGGGPGSFTGLRIAAAIGKGIAHGGRHPLCAVSSLALTAGVALEEEGSRAASTITTVLDALRGEWYAQRFDVRDQALIDAGPVRRVEASLLDMSWIGPGRPISVAPHARGIVRCGALIEPVDAARWEPSYGRLAEAAVQRAARTGTSAP